MNLLDTLQLTEINYGTCFAPGQWCETSSVGQIDSINPSNGEIIASVYNSNKHDYEAVINSSLRAFKEWRCVPAPKRGCVIQQIAERLRYRKSALGSLVALEMGKSKQEGEGEVQEMIDMADFAVGLSRQLNGKTMHSTTTRQLGN